MASTSHVLFRLKPLNRRLKDRKNQEGAGKKTRSLQVSCRGPDRAGENRARGVESRKSCRNLCGLAQEPTVGSSSSKEGGSVEGLGKGEHSVTVG